MIIENFEKQNKKIAPKESVIEKTEVVKQITKERTGERFFLAERKKELKVEENMKLYIVVSIIFLLGFLIGIICFKRVINDSKIKEEVIKYDFFFEKVEDKSIVVADMMYENISTILIYWVVGISIVGAPLLIIFCLYKGAALAIIISSVLIKYGFETGYTMLIKNVFLQHFLTDFVIVFLTVSSIKVMYRILFQKHELKSELIRHSVLCIIGLLTLFTAIGINCMTILNNFT